MTGFGRGDAQGEDGSAGYLVEIRSVNHRFGEVVCRLPRDLVALEERLKRLVKRRCRRGRVEVTVISTAAPTSAGRLAVDSEGLRGAVEDLQSIREELGLAGEVDLSLLTRFRELFTFQPKAADEERAWSAMVPALEQALDVWGESRAREGKALEADIRERLVTIGGLVAEVEREAAGVGEEVAARLHRRLTELLGEVEVDSGRLEQEVAFLATRSDITEEIVRLRSHVEHFQSTLDGGDAPGRRLDFLLQEMLREVNTIGSKTGQVAIINRVVALKELIEQIREQVQNIE